MKHLKEKFEREVRESFDQVGLRLVKAVIEDNVSLQYDHVEIDDIVESAWAEIVSTGNAAQWVDEITRELEEL